MKAFPRADGKYDSSKTDEQGMDLRDYFAAKAMQGIVANSAFETIEGMVESTQVAYMIADAMMEAREQ
jgi:hypothetical protein